MSKSEEYYLKEIEKYEPLFDRPHFLSRMPLIDKIKECSKFYSDERHYLIEIIELLQAELLQRSWVKLTDRLPEIPKGKYGVGVIIATWDGEYQDVTSCNYIIVTNRDNKHIDPTFEHLPVGSADFAQLYFGGGKSGWMPIMDEITHWQYYPKAPRLEEK